MKRCESCNKAVPDEEMSYDKRCLSCQDKLEEGRKKAEERRKFFPKVMEEPYKL